jgi:uncharacterized protein YutD
MGKIKDGFNFGRLDCQYFEICNSYDNKKCRYGANCPSHVTIGNSEHQFEISIRDSLRNTLENYVETGCLDFQLKMMEGDNEKEKEESDT